MKVYKYSLVPIDYQTLVLPKGAKILSVAEQKGQIVLYALVNPETTEPFQTVEVFIAGTGHTRWDAEDAMFVGTVKLFRGDLMFHIFVRIP